MNCGSGVARLIDWIDSRSNGRTSAEHNEMRMMRYVTRNVRVKNVCSALKQMLKHIKDVTVS